MAGLNRWHGTREGTLCDPTNVGLVKKPLGKPRTIRKGCLMVWNYARLIFLMRASDYLVQDRVVGGKGAASSGSAVVWKHRVSRNALVISHTSLVSNTTPPQLHVANLDYRDLEKPSSARRLGDTLFFRRTAVICERSCFSPWQCRHVSFFKNPNGEGDPF